MLQAIARSTRKLTRIERVDDTLVMFSEYGILKIAPINESIIRVLFTRKDYFNMDVGMGIIHDHSYPDWCYEETDSFIFLKTTAITLEIAKESSSIRYFSRNNELLLAERNQEGRILEEFDSYKIVPDESIKVEKVETPDGIKQVITEAKKVFDKKLYHTRLFLEWQDDEALFGLGQAEEGVLNLRGTTQYLHQANMKIAVPFLLSTKNYGILMATGSPGIFNDTAYGSYLYTEASEQMDYYFIIGGCFDEIIKGYRLLSGKAVMLPKWAFGYLQSQERYETAEELINTVKEYRRRSIGLDCIILDWQSWKGNLWGQKTFDEERFPGPEQMMERIHELNARLMVSIWPNMSIDCDNYREFYEKRLLLPMSDIYDAFREESRQLYWEQVNNGLFSKGIDAWWCDSSEPVTPEWSHLEKPEPSTMYNEYLKDCGSYIPIEKCNTYGLVHAQGIYEGQRSICDAKRVVNLTRSGYTGQQKYGTILWSGDTCAGWDRLKKQIIAGLSFCASGLPYWTMDIGGFFVKKGAPWFWSGEYEAGNDDLGYRELYTRWFQLGAFLPIFRAHGTDVRREVWAFGKPGEMFYDALVSAIELRYKLMPYIYSLAGNVWREDGTIMRMLAFDFPYDKNAINIIDQYMFGTSIMVCPVTEPMYYCVRSKPIECVEYSRQVYLPSGTRWYDFWTNQMYEGGTIINASADISKIPLFVREGSIIPMTEAMNFVNEKPDANIELRIYPGRDCEFLLYEDCGDGYMYEMGEYSLTRIKWQDENGKVTYDMVHSSESKKNNTNRLFEYIVQAPENT